MIYLFIHAASCCSCLTFGWSIELGIRDAWKSISCPEPISSPGSHSMGFFQAGCRVCSPEVRCCSSVTGLGLFPPDSGLSQLTVATAKSNPNQSSFSPGAVSHFIESSTTCVRKLSPMLSKNLLVCWCPSLWHSRSGKSTPWVPEPANRTFLPVDWRKLNLLLPDKQWVADTDHNVTHVGLPSSLDPKAAGWLPRQNTMHSTWSLTFRRTPSLAFLP